MLHYYSRHIQQRKQSKQLHQHPLGGSLNPSWKPGCPCSSSVYYSLTLWTELYMSFIVQLKTQQNMWKCLKWSAWKVYQHINIHCLWYVRKIFICKTMLNNWNSVQCLLAFPQCNWAVKVTGHTSSASLTTQSLVSFILVKLPNQKSKPHECFSSG